MAEESDGIMLSISADVAALRRSQKKMEEFISGFSKTAERKLTGVATSADKNFKAIEASGLRMRSKLDGMFARPMQSLAAPLAGIGAALSVNSLIQYSDTWSDLNARVGNAAGSMDAAAPVMDRISEIARRTYSDLGQTAEAYITNAGTLRELGYTTQQTLDYTEALNNALVISGAKGDVAASVMSALSKAMALGKLSGDNLNTVIAQGDRVAQALADSMGVTTLELRKLGTDGKITRRELFNITSQLEKLRKEADVMPATVSDAFGQLHNAVLQWVGGMDQASSASVKVADHILSLADNFGAVADVALNLATILGTALAGKAMAGLVVGAVSSAQSVGYLTAAMRAGTVSAATFNAALGPIALTIGAVAAGILLLSNNQSAAEKSAERLKDVIDLNSKALDSAKDASGRYTQALRDQIAMQLEAALASAEMARADYAAAEARATGFRKMTGMNFAPFEYAANTASANAAAVEGAALKIEKQLARIDQAGVTKPVVPVDTDDKKKGRTKQTPAEKFDSDLQKIADRTAALVAETEAQRKINPLINDYGYAIEKARVEQELLNAANKAGVAITPELRAEIGATAEQFAIATVEAQMLAEAQDKIRQNAEEMASFQKDLAQGMVDGFVNGASAAEMFANALGKVADKLIEIGLNSIFDTGKGGFNIFGALGSMFGGGDAWSGLRLAGGGSVHGPGGPTGDKIPAMLSDGEYVINAKAASQHRALLESINFGRLPAFRDGGSVGVPNISPPSIPLPQVPQILSSPEARNAGPQEVTIAVDVSGARGNQEIEQMVQSGVRQGIKLFSESNHFVNLVGRSLPRAHSRGMVR